MIGQHEMIVDLFAGGGGASVAIHRATGRHPDLAVNHDAHAIAVHTANHPTTRHEQASVWNVEPRAATQGRPIGLLWASPDCRHFSRASGGRPRWKSVRSLPGVVLTWAARVRPRVICVENVAEFTTWGPLLDDGTPCPDRVGRSFKAWVGRLRGLGYQVDWRELCAADFGAPTIRTRLFVVARCDGAPITWPQPTHSRRPSMFEQPWRPAAECIRWDVPAPSIFARERPLAAATCRRIAAGIRRFVMDAAEPFIVTIDHQSNPAGVAPGGAPLSAITSKARHAVVAAFLAQHNGGVIGRPAGEPVSTILTAGCHQQLVTAELAEADAARADQVAAFLVRYNGTNIGQDLREPLGAATTKPRFALVHVAGVPHAIVDIGMRMLLPEELAAAQGLPADYRWSAPDGTPMTKTTTVRLIGNSVSPPPAEALLRALLARRGIPGGRRR